MGLGVARRQGDGAPTGRRRLFQFALGPEHGAEGVVDLGEIRLQGDGAAAGGGRLVQPTLEPQDIAEVGVEVGDAVVQADRLGHEAGRDVVAADLEATIPRLCRLSRWLGIDGQDTPVEGLGLGQPAAW